MMKSFQNDSTLVYEGVRFCVRRMLLPDRNGVIHAFEAVQHPGAAVILPFLNAEEIVMIRNRRFAVGKELWELPAGILEPGEPPATTALRELIEETGYKAARCEKLFSFYTSPGMSSEIIHAYSGHDLSFVGAQPEASDWISVHKLKEAELRDMLLEGKIEDGKTALTLLYYFQKKDAGQLV